MSEEEINIHLRNTFHDPTKDQELGPNEMLIDQESPNQEFNIGIPTWKELQAVVSVKKCIIAWTWWSSLYCKQALYWNPQISLKIVKSNMKERQNSRANGI